MTLLAFRAFRAVFGTGNRTAVNTGSIEGTANDVVLNTRKVFNTAAANEDNRVLLQVVAFTADVRDNLES